MSETRKFWQSATLLWLAVAAILVIVNWGAIAAGHFPDSDDQMRLLQVRDWLAGQSWFDVTQYRLNAPAGVPMHWSRLIDLPIAAVILATRPLLGQSAAETAALVLVPLLTLGVVLALLAALCRRLLGAAAALFALCIAPLSVELLHQLRPMRIDHHGWQMALALAVALALTGRDLKRAGLCAGIAIGLWLSVSVEGLPLIAAALACVALRWAMMPDSRDLFRATTASAALTALVAFALTHRVTAWGSSPCDASSPAYLAVLATGAAAAFAVTALRLPVLPVRLAALGAVGIVALLPIAVIAPVCARGPFAALDPLVHDVWYLHVMEGLPIWRQDWPTIVNSAALPLLGLIGGALAVRRSRSETRVQWLTVFFLATAAFAASLLVQRASGVAILLALPGVTALAYPWLLRARAIRSLPARLAATVAVLLAAAPGVAAAWVIGRVAPDVRSDAVRVAQRCADANDMAALRVLPRGNVLAPLDIAPSILLLTPHDAVASGHHRGGAAMHDVIAALTGSDADAEAIVRRRRVDYVAFCPGLAEIISYEDDAPHGLLAALDHGRTPPWLRRVALAGASAKVWRVLSPQAAERPN